MCLVLAGFLMMAGESVDPSLLAHAIGSLESLIAGRATAANAAREAHLAKLRAEAGEAGQGRLPSGTAAPGLTRVLRAVRFGTVD